MIVLASKTNANKYRVRYNTNKVFIGKQIINNIININKANMINLNIMFVYNNFYIYLYLFASIPDINNTDFRFNIREPLF